LPDEMFVKHQRSLVFQIETANSKKCLNKMVRIQKCVEIKYSRESKFFIFKKFNHQWNNYRLILNHHFILAKDLLPNGPGKMLTHGNQLYIISKGQHCLLAVNNMGEYS